MTVHDSPITVEGWQGSGYAILDSEYGVGAYKISGGNSGGAANIISALFLLAMSSVGSGISNALAPAAQASPTIKPSGVASDIFMAILEGWGKSWQEIAALSILAVLAGILMVLAFKGMVGALVALEVSKNTAILVAGFIEMLVVVISFVKYLVNDK